MTRHPQEPRDATPGRGAAPGRHPPPPPDGPLPPPDPRPDRPDPPLPQSEPPLARQPPAANVPVEAPQAAPALAGEGRGPEPGWSAWQGLLAFVSALATTLVLGAVVVGAIALSLGAPLGDGSPALNIAGVVVQDVVFIGAAVAFAAISARPRAWHFGLRRTRLWSTIGWALLGLFVYFVFNVLYEALIHPRADQSVADALGVNDSAALLVLGGFVIIVMAPIAEEFFFRAFFYRALRNSLARRLGRRGGVVLAALLTGLIFGVVHFEPDAVAIIPVLTALGMMFCLVYERTGSLFAVIALHALINSTAYVTVAKNSAPVALSFGGGMILACVLLPRLLSRGPVPAAA